MKKKNRSMLGGGACDAKEERRPGKAQQRRDKSESGQILILAVGTMTFVLILAGLAIDVGFWAQTKREVQNDADAMVLAGVRSMPDEDAALDAAMTWAGYNEVAGDEIFALESGETCGGDSLDGTVTARLQRNQETFLAQLLGITDIDLDVCATARIGVAAAGQDLLPFGFLEEDPEIDDVCFFESNPSLWNNSCLLKIPSRAKPGRRGTRARSAWTRAASRATTTQVAVPAAAAPANTRRTSRMAASVLMPSTMKSAPRPEI